MKPSNHLVLTVLHNIFLSKDECYKLINGKNIITEGVSVPVWVVKNKEEKKGYTTEPAKEVFCKYYVTNKNKQVPIRIRQDGYLINLPQLPENWEEPSLDNNTWRKMSASEREQWYGDNATPLNADNLRDLDDNGSEMLRFEQYTKKKDESGEWIEMGHFVNIARLSFLEKTMEPVS